MSRVFVLSVRNGSRRALTFSLPLLFHCLTLSSLIFILSSILFVSFDSQMRIEFCMRFLFFGFQQKNSMSFLVNATVTTSISCDSDGGGNKIGNIVMDI